MEDITNMSISGDEDVLSEHGNDRDEDFEGSSKDDDTLIDKMVRDLKGRMFIILKEDDIHLETG